MGTGLKNTNHPRTKRAIGEKRFARPHAVEELLGFERQWFAMKQLGSYHVAHPVVHEDLIAVTIGPHGDSLLVDEKFLGRLHIIVKNHFTAADDDIAPQFHWR